ncbi:hypothetical protein AA313_de0204047 [Arthrobotrys entomopaga]|nr:hypothetical protein AA313_de0204047 [Arthrobotrys entomopaga]
MSIKREPSPELNLSTTDEVKNSNKEDKIDNASLKAQKTTGNKKRKSKEPSAPKIKKEKANEGRWKRGTWTDEQDATLHNLITNNQGGNDVKAPWNDIYKSFLKAYPGTDKALNSMQMRWKQKIRAGDTILTESEKALFKQAVTEIDGNERTLAYAWRFKDLGGRDLNKSAATKLHKMLKAGQLEVDETQE